MFCFGLASTSEGPDRSVLSLFSAIFLVTKVGCVALRIGILSSMSFAGLRPEFGVVDLIVQKSCSVVSTENKGGDASTDFSGVSSISSVQTLSVRGSLVESVVKEIPAAAKQTTSG